jgi:hypothetical protein
MYSSFASKVALFLLVCTMTVMVFNRVMVMRMGRRLKLSGDLRSKERYYDTVRLENKPSQTFASLFKEGTLRR